MFFDAYHVAVFIRESEEKSEQFSLTKWGSKLQARTL